MDGDRKYKQHGYQDSARKEQYQGGQYYGPRTPVDGPAAPRLVRAVTASRCFECSAPLPADFDFTQPCPRCAAALHCCSQCAHFDTAARFQCLRPVPERIPYKNKPNECALFSPRITVARETAPPPAAVRPPAAVTPLPEAPPPVSRKVANARAAFEDLFKKS